MNNQLVHCVKRGTGTLIHPFLCSETSPNSLLHTHTHTDTIIRMYIEAHHSMSNLALTPFGYQCNHVELLHLWVEFSWNSNSKDYIFIILINIKCVGVRFNCNHNHDSWWSYQRSWYIQKLLKWASRCVRATAHENWHFHIIKCFFFIRSLFASTLDAHRNYYSHPSKWAKDWK